MKKIIRDRYVDIIDVNELSFVHGDDHQTMLIEKMAEELQELEDSDYKDVDEYADVLEVLLGLAELNGISRHDIFAARIVKQSKLGGFKSGLILTREEEGNNYDNNL